jgi:nitrogen fixation protein FixH
MENFNSQAARPRWRVVPMMLLAVAVMFTAPHVAAHSDAHFDAQPAPHGGRMRMAGPLHLELVMNAGRIVVYVTDHLERPQASAAAEAALRFPAQNLRVPLTASGDNTFSAPLPAGVTADSEAVLFVKLNGIEAQSARFNARAAAGAEHDSH